MKVTAKVKARQTKVKARKTKVKARQTTKKLGITMETSPMSKAKIPRKKRVSLN